VADRVADALTFISDEPEGEQQMKNTENLVSTNAAKGSRQPFSLTAIVPSKEDADKLVKKIRRRFGNDFKIKVEKVSKP
jgi:hypothetical protein